MAPNPVAYAEETLDVHGPWKLAQERLEAHGQAHYAATRARNMIRTHKSTLKDRQMELTAEAPTLIPNYMDLGVQQRKDAIKILIGGDSSCQGLEDLIEEHQAALDAAQADIKHHEQGLFVLTARMNELGGLLHFYAASKEAQTLKRSNQTTTEIEE